MISSKALRHGRSQVLVVGAGPVGLLAALRLRANGIDVRVVDQQSEQRAHTFPVVLHAQSLRLLNDLGVTAALFWQGRPVTKLAVYADDERRAVLDLPGAAGIAAGALTLPQDILRQTLTNALREHGVMVEWNTRLAVLQQDERLVWGRLVHDDPARMLSAGSPEASAFEADFLIGADGYDSTVRAALGIELVDHGSLQSFAFFDAATERSGNEAQLAISDEWTNSVYPLRDDRSRFSFQITGLLDKTLEAQHLHELVQSRMPWYGETIHHCDWSGVAEFRRGLVTRFGQGRAWLAGEAAHLTGPLGVQSLNIGLDEANELALRITDQLSGSHRPAFGTHYEARRRRQWQELLGLKERASPTERSPEWARRHLARLMPCLPASDGDLDDLLRQLRVTPTSAPPRS
jgi:2-polyprenyl-6-methoxyphenol hydroxylase-like FAD-dependent oxidoreductase